MHVRSLASHTLFRIQALSRSMRKRKGESRASPRTRSPYAACAAFYRSRSEKHFARACASSIIRKPGVEFEAVTCHTCRLLYNTSAVFLWSPQVVEDERSTC